VTDDLALRRERNRNGQARYVARHLGKRSGQGPVTPGLYSRGRRLTFLR
jgi:hypothetical protein